MTYLKKTVYLVSLLKHLHALKCFPLRTVRKIWLVDGSKFYQPHISLTSFLESGDVFITLAIIHRVPRWLFHSRSEI